MQRSTGRRQVMFNIMGLRCAEKRHLPQAEQQGVDGRGIRCSFTPIACQASRQRMLQLHKAASIHRRGLLCSFPASAASGGTMRFSLVGS